METYKEYFPTKSYRIAELRLSSLLRAERDRLDALAESLGRECAIGPDNLREQLPEILKFTEAYHAAYDQYLKAVLVQQPNPIQCRPACGNCCHHYPMSVEPFELIYMYNELRKRDDLLTLMEGCQMRSDKFESFFEARKEKGLSEDDAEDGALHDYFSWWRSCPFSDAKGDCTVYPLRTVSCRMYFSETDPKYCTPDMLQTEKNDSYIVYMPDVVEDAVYGISEHYSALDLPESFFGGLLAINGYEGVLGG
jgi:Fe-S-cluster containining protein